MTPDRARSVRGPGGGPVVAQAIWDTVYAYYERLGIADDSGLPTHVGSPAWLAAMGEAIQAESTATDIGGGEDPERREQKASPGAAPRS